MKLKKLIFSFAIIILIFQYGFEIICNATDENDSKTVILNDFSEINQNLEPVEDTNQSGLNIYSEAAILMEAETGKILYDKDIYSRKYPASTTKILTAILAIENCDLNEKATASHEAIFSVKSGYSIANIQEGESFTVKELLEVLMIQSANEAANVLAEHISGSVSRFANLMNQKAKEIGCLDSNFVNANGAHNENHYSTAYDLAMITRYCMKNEIFREIISKKQCSLPMTEKFQEERIFRNTNSLMQESSKYYYPYYNGGKTGYTTPAKNCLISCSKKDEFELISVILHAETTENGQSARYLDTINLFEYGYNNFTRNDILAEYDMLGVTEIEKNVSEETRYLFNIEDEAVIETVTGAIKKDYNNNETNGNHASWIQIILGIAILLGVGKYYFVKNLKANVAQKNIRDIQNKQINKDELYNFKLS